MSIPTSRREALAAERQQAQKKPTKPAEHRAPRRKFVPSVERPAPQASKPAPRRRGAKLASIAVIGVVAAFTVTISLPAEALMSSSDVQAKQIAAAQAQQNSQVILAGGSGSTVSGDSYDATSESAYASESGITEIEATFTNDPNGTVQWPFAVGVHIGDGYGSTAGRSSAHHGQDFNPGIGAPIQAIADGVVTFAEDGEGDLGVHMMITHQINGQTITSVYAHMIHGSMRFKVGDTVKVGQVIGNVGNTGYSTGPHLHFEIRLGGIDGPWTDPLVWLRANTN